MVEASIGQRMAAVALSAAECVNASMWQVSCVEAGVARSQRLEILRRPSAGHAPGRGAPTLPVDSELAGRPSLAEAAEGSAFSATRVDGDPAERRALLADGLTSRVVAGGYDPDALPWLVELSGDEQTHDLRSFAAVLHALVQAALGFPRAVSPRRRRG